jgi:hypothetical protein
MPGTMVLYHGVLARTPSLAGNGVYNCRHIYGSSSWSCHAEGRAADFSRRLPNGGPDPSGIPTGSQADSALKQWINLFVVNHEALGVQRMIYKTTMWTVNKGFSALAPMSGVAKLHQNHMHVEQTRAKSQTLTVAQFNAIADGTAIPPAGVADDMILVHPNARPITEGPFRGRWPFYAIQADSLIGYNGAKIKGGTAYGGNFLAPLPKGHAAILGLAWGAGNAIVVGAQDGGTFTFSTA